MPRNVQYYAVRTNPRCERRAALGLRAEGFEVYLPVEVKWRPVPAKLVTRAQRGKLKERHEVPLMPGYLFVRLADEFAKVRAVHGVAEMVGINGNPAAIPDKAVAQLREIEAEINAAHADPAPAYAQGEQVRVKAGIWQGHVGRFLAESPEGRIRLMLEGKRVYGAQEFKPEQVEKAA